MTTIYVSTRDVADFLGLKTTTAIVNLIDRGMLPCARKRVLDGGRLQYRPTVHEVDDYLRTYDPTLAPRWRAKWPTAFCDGAMFHVPQTA